MIFIGSSFFLLNVMLTVLLGDKVRPLSVAHASNLLVTPCSTLDVTLLLLVGTYIARSSAKSDPFTSFPSSPNIPLIATWKRVILSTTSCGIPKSVYLFFQVYPSTRTLITNEFSDEFQHSSQYFQIVSNVLFCAPSLVLFGGDSLSFSIIMVKWALPLRLYSLLHFYSAAIVRLASVRSIADLKSLYAL